MRKLAPELLRGSELPQVEHIVNEAFQFLTEQPKVMIRVASELEGPLSSKVTLMASRVGYEGQVVLTADPELELSDCRISWHAGAVERSLNETWEQIDEMVDRVLRGLPAREHPEPRSLVDKEAEDRDEDENDGADAPVTDDLANTVDVTPTRPQTEPARALVSEE
jgi:flagellar assembly protein FliH